MVGQAFYGLCAVLQLCGDRSVWLEDIIHLLSDLLFGFGRDINVYFE